MTPPYRVSQAADQAIPLRTVSDDFIAERSRVVSWWSGVKREGEWVLPRAFRAFACMGHVELDLTHARMGMGITEMELNCLMGGIDVIVPPDIRVLCDGDAMMGNFEVTRVGNTTPHPDAPTLRISGKAYLGAVSVKVVDPNAPSFAEKLKATWAALKG